jgi:hypothetical protein
MCWAEECEAGIHVGSLGRMESAVTGDRMIFRLRGLSFNRLYVKSERGDIPFPLQMHS